MMGRSPRLGDRPITLLILSPLALEEQFMPADHAATGAHRTRGNLNHRKDRWISRAAWTVLIALVSFVAVAVLSGNYQIRPVLSGSMRPGLSVGGVAVSGRVPLKQIKVRDVIVFSRPGNVSELVVHRIISLSTSPSGLIARTQGDANNVPDPWILSLHGRDAYRVMFSLPALGYPAVWLHSSGGHQTILVLAGVLIVIAAVTVWRRGNRTKTNEMSIAEDEHERLLDLSII
jgi:signal peptidase I